MAVASIHILPLDLLRQVEAIKLRVETKLKDDFLVTVLPVGVQATTEIGSPVL